MNQNVYLNNFIINDIETDFHKYESLYDTLPTSRVQVRNITLLLEKQDELFYSQSSFYS